jgi:hypothetical protein
MTLPIDRTSKATLDTNLNNGITSDAPAVKASDDVVYNTIDELYNYVLGLIAAGVLSPYPPAQYNKLINSNFDVWQGGTSFSIASGYLADQWVLLFNAASVTGAISQQPFAIGQTTVPNDPKYFMRINPTALNGCTAFTLYQPIEGVQNFSGQKVSFSFWAEADTPQTITVQLNQNFGTGGSPSGGAQSPSVSFALSTSWKKFTGTVLVPSASGKTLGSNNNDHIDMFINLPTTAPYSIDIAQVQLNSGDTALPFQPRNIEDEARLCRRFWQFLDTARARYADASSAVCFTRDFQPMRAIPAVTITTFGGTAPTLNAAKKNSLDLLLTNTGTTDSTYTLKLDARL